MRSFVSTKRGNGLNLLFINNLNNNIMNYFLLETLSDNGTVFLKTNAANKETAIDNFCNLYFAPKNAIKNVYQFDVMFWNFKASTLINKKLATLI